MVEITLFPGGKKTSLKIEKDATVMDILERLQLSPDIVVVMRLGRPIPIDSPVNEGDELKIVRVVSGG